MSGADRQPDGPGEPRRERGGREHRPGRAPRRRPRAEDPGVPAASRQPTAAPAAGSESPPAWNDAPAAAEERRFEVDGETWIARPMGESAVGHGAGARAYLVAVRFFRGEDDTPVSEVLIPRGRFEMLYDEELEELLRQAKPLAPAPEPRGGEPPRASIDELDEELPPEI